MCLNNIKPMDILIKEKIKYAYKVLKNEGLFFNDLRTPYTGDRIHAGRWNTANTKDVFLNAGYSPEHIGHYSIFEKLEDAIDYIIADEEIWLCKVKCVNLKGKQRKEHLGNGYLVRKIKPIMKIKVKK